jgi:hypothetical protein
VRRRGFALLLGFAAATSATACMEPNWSEEEVKLDAAIAEARAFAAAAGTADTASAESIEERIGDVLVLARHCGGRCPADIRGLALDFIHALDGSADERLAEAALVLYVQAPEGFCAAIATRPADERESLLGWAQSGAELTQPDPQDVECP